MSQTLAIHPDMTLAELAVQVPKSIPWLLQRKLDFCCGGYHNLAWACQVHEWEFQAFCDELASYLQQASQIPNHPEGKWEAHRLSELLDHILERYHEAHRKDFRVILPLMEKVLNVHAATHPFLYDLGEAVEGLISELEPHMKKEELILFPTIRSFTSQNETLVPSMGRQQSLAAMSVMRNDHETAGLSIEKISWLTNDFELPETACLTFTTLYKHLETLRNDLLVHIHLENNILFPLFENLEFSMS